MYVCIARSAQCDRRHFATLLANKYKLFMFMWGFNMLLFLRITSVATAERFLSLSRVDKFGLTAAVLVYVQQRNFLAQNAREHQTITYKTS